jgi:hypothetical protein
MATTKDPQKQKNIQQDQRKINRSEFKEKTYEDVWQDKSAPERARIASTQPYRANQLPRSHGLSKNSDRSQKHSTSRRTVHAIAWVEKPISMLINQKALEWQVSRSKAAARLIGLGLESDLLTANSSLLAQIVRETIAAECRSFFARLSGILFRIYLLLTQSLHLQHNLVARSGFQRKLSTEQVEKIIAWSKTQAKSEVVQKHGEVDAALDRAVIAWLDQFDGKVKTGESGRSN